MKKLVAFLYTRHKTDKRTSDIPHLQTFTDLILFLMFPFFLLEELLHIDIIGYFRQLSMGEKWLEYFIGICCFIIPLYFIFRILFPEKKLTEYYEKYNYPKNYLFTLRIIFIAVAAISLFITLKLKGKI